MLRQTDEGHYARVVPDLPRCGSELAHWVEVILKSSGTDSVAEMSGFIHQASVRAEVVVELIEDLKKEAIEHSNTSI